MADFLNPSFETPDADGRPGWADSWFWKTSCAAGEWAEFNSDPVDLAPWNECMEQFSAAFAVAWSWTFADAAARIASGPFAPEDMGRVGLQLDDNSLWTLTSDSPVGWQLLTRAVQDWIAAIEDAVLAVTLFNGATTSYSARREMFEIWAGLNWLDAPNLLRQDDAVFKALGGSYCGWKGWFDASLGTAQFPIPVEVFSEAWGNDPWSTIAGNMWQPDTAPSGILRGHPLTFPIVIPPNQARFDVWQQSSNTIYRIDVTPGTYTTLADLVNDLQGAWGGTVPLTCLEFTAWADADGNEGVQLGWDGTSGIDTVCFGILASEHDADVRPLIGLAGLASDSGDGQVRYPVALVAVPPLGAAADDYFEMDPWSLLSVRTEYDLVSALFPVPYNWLFATWNTFTGLPERVQEMMDLQPWFGATATWAASWPALYAWAVFTGGAGGGIVESFENPTTFWPDNLWT